MTREEAINYFKRSFAIGEGDDEKYHNEVLEYTIKALEQEPCEDCVSRQAVIDAMYALCDTGETLKENPWRDNPHIDAIIDAIDNLPSVTPQQKIGHWIAEINDYGEVMGWHCDKCYEDSGFATTCKWDYCPNCGAKMEVRNRYDRQ